MEKTNLANILNPEIYVYGAASFFLIYLDCLQIDDVPDHHRAQSGPFTLTGVERESAPFFLGETITKGTVTTRYSPCRNLQILDEGTHIHLHRDAQES